MRNIGTNNSHNVGVDPTRLFSMDSEINKDVLVLIRNYLRKCGLNATVTTLTNESNLNMKQAKTTKKLVKEAVMNGDWEVLREISKTGPVPRLRRAFLYLVNRQEFLELVHKQEQNQAFVRLIRHLKPLENQAKIAGDDFRDLAYLATCRSVTDSPAFRTWEGIEPSRRKLARELGALVNRNDLFRYDEINADDDEEGVAPNAGQELNEDSDLNGLISSDSETESDAGDDDPQQQLLHSSQQKPARLVTLLQQAYAYQVEKKMGPSAISPNTTNNSLSGSVDTSAAPRISSLLVDFSAPILPDATKSIVLSGHEQSVKCLEFIDGDRKLLASGSSDCDVILWDFEHPSLAFDEDEKHSRIRRTPGVLGAYPRTTLKGHTARVWDLSSNRDGTILASVGADSALRLWDITKIRSDEASSLLSRLVETGHSGDAYSVSFHPDSKNHVVTAGQDQTVRLIDIERDRVIKVFRGHTGGVVHAVFNPMGNLIVTGSKDSTVKFFDVVSGVCVKTLPQLLGAVSSVQLNKGGDKLLIGTKDSSNRLWDIRSTGTVLSRFKGHVNSSKNFIRCQFGSSDQIILGGSEDGAVYVWDADSGKVLDRLTGHAGSVFRATWSQQWNLLSSCSEDGTVRLWDAKNTL
jgi:COMPASS component SWD3